MYTLVFILVTILILAGLALFGYLILKLDKWIDRKDRLGDDSIVKKNKNKGESHKTVENKE
jgi:hypothetical protein